MDSRTTTLAPDVMEALGQGAVLLTGNDRLARGLGYAYNQAMQETGEAVWTTPTILPFGSWLRALWRDELVFHQEGDTALLSVIQEEAVWERVIEAWCRREGHTLMQIAAAAETARNAYELVQHWGLDLPTDDLHPVEDVQAFLAWEEAFNAWCAENGWLSVSRLPGKVAKAIRKSALTLPSEVFLAGIEEKTPAQQDLLDSLRKSGTKTTDLNPPLREEDVSVLASRTAEDEITACAHWLRERLEVDPDQTVAVIVPDLAEHRAAIATIFEDVLTPKSVLPGASPQRHFNFSLGPPLSAYPLVAAALNALDLLRDRVDLNRFGSLLRSPLLGEGNSEAQARALLDARLRKDGERTLRVPWLVHMAGERSEGNQRHSPRLESRLVQLLERIESLPSEAGPAAWEEVFHETVAILGWPGERTLNSAEHQVLEKWNDLLDRFAGLESIVEPMTLAGALERLRRLADETNFQPKSDAAPVQVMGFLEATGAQFDAVWVMGLTDTQLPGTPRTNPLLPRDLQRDHNLPHSSPQRELEFAQRRLTGLIRAAPEVVLSYPKFEEDRELVPSPLIVAYPHREVGVPDSGFVRYAERVIESGAGALEEIDDAPVPLRDPDASARGGSGVLKSQAACPFQAYARYRLHATPLEEPRDGLDARDQGNLVHNAIELLWRELGDQASLLDMSDEKLSALIERVVGKAIAELAPRRPAAFTPTRKKLQQVALERLLHRWLELEKTRAPFRVLDTEKGLFDQRIGRLTIGKLVVDRIDELEDSDTIIIDYKTGRGRTRNAWRGERPDDPQLPLYATLSEGVVAGVQFANVNPNKPSWSGVTRDNDVFEKQKTYPSGTSRAQWEALYPDWQSLLRGWRRDLEALADEFVAGDARVDPKNGDNTCRTCHLPSACRVAELKERSGVATIGINDPEDDE